MSAPHGEAEEAAPRERRQLHEQAEREKRGERCLEPVTGLEAQVDRRQHEQRDHELDSEVVRVAGQPVRPEDAPAVDGAEDVDRGVAARDRLDQQRVEVPDAELGGEQLHDPVDGVQRDAAAERGERVPVEPLRPPGEQRHPRDEEAEVEDELDHPLRPLRQRLLGVEVEEAGEVEEQERREEHEPDDRGPRQTPVSRARSDPRRRRRGTPRSGRPRAKGRRRAPSGPSRT